MEVVASIERLPLNDDEAELLLMSFNEEKNNVLMKKKIEKYSQLSCIEKCYYVRHHLKRIRGAFNNCRIQFVKWRFVKIDDENVMITGGADVNGLTDHSQ